jgi:hypothetical protein
LGLEDSFSWNRGIENVLGTLTKRSWKKFKWWFDKIHPEDSIKMSIRLYLYRTKNRKLARSIPFQMLE